MLVVVSNDNGGGVGGDGVDWWWCLLEGNNVKNGKTNLVPGNDKGEGVRVDVVFVCLFIYFIVVLKEK